MANTKRKVGAFVLRVNGPGVRELLLFTHPDCPEAPIQIPGGSIEPGEDVEAPLWREIHEETGLSNLTLVRKVGVSQFPSMFAERQVMERHCYLSAPADVPERWIHQVGGSGVDGGMRFAFEWRRITRDFSLSGDLGVFLAPQYLLELYAEM